MPGSEGEGANSDIIVKGGGRGGGAGEYSRNAASLQWGQVGAPSGAGSKRPGNLSTLHNMGNWNQKLGTELLQKFGTEILSKIFYRYVV